jgi:serine/threonine-protein kinase
MPNSLRKLGQRKIAQWALAYAAGAWVALQAVSLAAGSYGWSAQVMRIGIGVALIGLLVTLVLAWYHGERGEQKASTLELLILATLLAVGGAVMWHSERQAPAPIASASTAAAPTPVSPPAALTLGVAVLPFANLSPDPDNAFFAGGVHEEVLTKLSHLPALRVISRTSMEKIAREKLDVREIGRRLGVSHVLEGSVRRAGDQVRVTVQLIEAGTDNHVWAENYDRKLDDVFAIQTEIALAISEQLKVKLTPKLQADLSERPTQDQAAYDRYLRAVEMQRSWGGAKGFRAMIALLEPAVAADPEFLAARVLLAEAYGRLFWTGEGGDNEVAKARAGGRHPRALARPAREHVGRGAVPLQREARLPICDREVPPAADAAAQRPGRSARPVQQRQAPGQARRIPRRQRAPAATGSGIADRLFRAQLRLVEERP